MVIWLKERSRTFAAYWLIVAAVAVALVFPDRVQNLKAVGLAICLFLGCFSIGRWLSSFLYFVPNRSLYVPLGLGALLAVVYPIAVFTTADGVFYAVWLILAALGVTEIRFLTSRIRGSYLWGAPLYIAGLWSCFTPIIFFDALVYHLGLPYQYLANGQMSVIPHHLYSTFPPFNQVLNLLFVALGVDVAVKSFSILVFFQTIWILVSFLMNVLYDTPSPKGNGHDQAEETTDRPELMVLPLLLLPSAWILIHIVTADLLVAMFFVAGIAAIYSAAEYWNTQRLLNAALFFAFAVYTKWNALLYVGFLCVLWFALQRWRMQSDRVIPLAKFYGMLFVLLLPLLIRNGVTTGDPLYPALSGILSSEWSPAQSRALELDSAPVRGQGFTDVLLLPLSLTLRSREYGSASPIGIFFIVGLAAYLFTPRKPRHVSALTIYALLCLAAWLFVFPNFRQVFPIFLLFYPMIYFSLSYLFRRFTRFMPALWVVGVLFCVVPLFQIYKSVFPLIGATQTHADYLRRHVDYYTAAQELNRREEGKVVLLGETGSAYLRRPAVVATAYDMHPFLQMVRQSDTAQDLSRRVNDTDIGFLLYDPNEYQRLVDKYGLWELEQRDKDVLREFLKRNAAPDGRTEDVFVLRIRD